MDLPKPRRVDNQKRLFDVDRPLTTLGAARSEVGVYFEELTASITGAVRLRTDSRCKICPDLMLSESRFIECKGCGKSKQVILYCGRVQKDQDFVASRGVELQYWLWMHSYQIKQAGSHGELRRGLTAGLRGLFILDSGTLWNSVSKREPRIVNSGCLSDGRRNGYGNLAKGYGVGWTVRLSWFAERAAELPGGLPGFNGVRVWVSQPGLAGMVARTETQHTIW